MDNGKWCGVPGDDLRSGWGAWDPGDGDRGKPTEKLSVPEFDGEGNTDHELGRTTRSYVRKVQVWLRCTKLPPRQRGLALYNALSGKAWIYAEELDVDRLASDTGVSYFLQWIQARFTEVEVSKIAQLMSDLFKRGRRRQDQSVRDFNVEFERMILRLAEIQCDVPPLIKAWLYLDKLRLSEGEELSLLSSVNNEYDCRRLQQAALLQDRSIRRPGAAASTDDHRKGDRRWPKHVHMTTQEDSSEDEVDEPQDDDIDLIDEDTAAEQYTAYMTYQGAKTKYKEMLKGRGVDKQALEARNQERLRLAKQRSYCSACKRRGHWHKDPECPLKQRSAVGGSTRCDGHDGGILAIVDTACTKTVAGYSWFETYVEFADRHQIPVMTLDEVDYFKFGASKVYKALFAVKAWFAIRGKAFVVHVSIVSCNVPLLFSRPVLGALGVQYDVAKQQVTLQRLGLHGVELINSKTGHPALPVSQFGDTPDLKAVPHVPKDGIYLRAEEAYMSGSSTFKPLFYPKRLDLEIQNMLESSTLLGPQGFFGWWKSANQSRDFWVETTDEMIRVHVVPRKHLFNPASWETSLTDLKKQLIDMLEGSRITEYMPCLGDGTILQVHTDEHYTSSMSPTEFVGPWIGRSRFRKVKSDRSLSVELDPTFSCVNASCCLRQIPMEHEEDRAARGVGCQGHSRACVLDGAGAPSDVDRADGEGTTHQDGQHEGHVQDESAGPDQEGPGVGDRSAGQGNPWVAPQVDQRGQADALRDDCGFREVPRMDVQGTARVVSSLVDRGGEPKWGRKSGAPDVGNLGEGGVGSTCRGLAEEDGDKGPRGHGESSPAQAEGDVPCDKSKRVVGFVMEQGGDHNLQDAGPPFAARDHQRRRPRRRTHRRQRGDPEDGGSSRSSEEETEQMKDPQEAYVTVYDTFPVDDPDEGDIVANDMEIGLGTSDGADVRSPRERARDGIRRRKLANRSTAQRLKDEARNLFNVLFVCAVTVGNWTQEIVSDPLWEAWAVMQPKHYLREGRSGVDCLEVFAGEARISTAFARRRRGVLQPRDLRYDHDLRRAQDQEDVLNDLINYKPNLLWMAPPCTVWCRFSRLNYDRQELRRLRKREKVLVRFASRAFELQHALGGIAVIENPRSSDLWREPELQRFLGQSATFADVDLCNFGMASLVDGRPLRKPLALMTNSETFAMNIAQTCTDPTHDHRPIQGRDTAWTAVYPTAFGTAVLHATDKAMGRPLGVHVQFPTDLVPEEAEVKDDDMGEWQPDITGASAISFKGKVNPKIASILKRIHQNLGRPPNRDLVRHLRLANAPEAVLRAAEQMSCRTCERNAKPNSSRVAHPCVALDFNEVVAADVMWLDVSDAKTLPVLNLVDVASTYQVVVPLSSTKSEELSRATVEGWINWAGAPKHMIVDLDSGFRDQFLQLMDTRGITVRCAAGQAHWQNGICERHGASWKEIWKKLVDEMVIVKSEFQEAVACTSDAKNQLRNKSGYSPRQWVFGCQPRANGDLFDGHLGPEEFENITIDEKMSRAHAIKVGARAAFFQCQTKAALQRAANCKARVEKTNYQAGDLVYIYREVKQRKGKKSGPTWLGPGTIIGKEGDNYWVARGGRCLLAAPEHLRTAHHEEISEMMRLKASLNDLRKVMQQADDDIIDEDHVESDVEMPPAENPEDIEAQLDAEMERSGNPLSMAARRERRLEEHARRLQALDDVPYQFKKARTGHETGQTAYMTKHAISERGKEKQLEKEIPWSMIPPDEREMYREAELKQWQEHLQYQAVRPLSVQESNEVLRRVGPERILSARFLYKDKNFAKRKSDPSIPAKPKARLCIAGQHDPDLGKVDMVTDAPTTSRHSIIMALQLALCRGWIVAVGDIRAAFLNGIPAPRDLYFRQPRRGMPTLQEGQIIEVLKGVFGLSTSPKLWWMKLSGDLKKAKIEYMGRHYKIVQNVVDPCVFQFVATDSNEVFGLLLTHVDDLMLLAAEDFSKHLQKVLKEMFPVDEWEIDNFEYVGCEYQCTREQIAITQKVYTKNRVEKMNIPAGSDNTAKANPVQMEENRTVIGCLSWLAKQTRPDIQYQVCQAQRKQKEPTIADVKETNRAVDDALKFQDSGVILRKVPEDRLCFLAYHDAAWGNAQPGDLAEGDEQWLGDHQVASQLGSLILVGDVDCVTQKGGPFSLIDWKSRSSHRVCRSTFAAETMACAEALESALFLRSLFVSMATLELVPDFDGGKHHQLHLVTDCRSLYDHIHKEGVPRAPSEKRLAIDIAGIRQALNREAEHQWRQLHGDAARPTPEKPLKPPIHWLPTSDQLADVLTKRLKCDEWWGRMRHGWLSLPLKAHARGL
eukprot:Skav231407  [mRNA]  locus=scaffold4039:44689:52020:- [translate_table: standard]